MKDRPGTRLHSSNERLSSRLMSAASNSFATLVSAVLIGAGKRPRRSVNRQLLYTRLLVRSRTQARRKSDARRDQQAPCHSPQMSSGWEHHFPQLGQAEWAQYNGSSKVLGG